MTDDRRGATGRRPSRRAPWVLIILATGGAALFILPLIGLLSRVPWSDLVPMLSSDLVVDALRLSLVTSVAAALISTMLGANSPRVPTWIIVCPVPMTSPCSRPQHR